MQCVANSLIRGWKLKLDKKWDSKMMNFGFKITGKVDETCASCPDAKKGTTGGSEILEGVPIACLSQGWKKVSLSVTKSSLCAAVVVI